MTVREQIEQLSALPPRKRLEAYRAIQDPKERLQVARALPREVFSEMLVEAELDGLKRHVREKQKPGKAA